MNVADIREHFINELQQENFISTRNGKMIELVGASFLADKDAIFGTPNKEYIAAEKDWYDSKSTNINDLAKFYGKAPKAWEYSANKHGEINSNYGLLIYSPIYHSQYENALRELVHDSNTRRATMVYTRPSIWKEYDSGGKNDFICTNAVTYYRRDNKLHCVVQMRSNDVVFGYRNDYAWQEIVLRRLALDLSDWYDTLIEPGDIHWQVQNLHVYEPHFKLVK